MEALIENAARLIEVFGRWPDFHDSEVHRIVLDRAVPGGPSLEARIHLFETTGDVDDRGYFVQRKHTLVTLRFTGIELVELSGFNCQNVIFDLELSPIDPLKHEGRRLEVTMSSSYGVGASFQCESASIVDVRPEMKS